MSPEELREEIRKLRNGIRQHRDSSGQNLCWYVPELWNLLPEKVEPKPEVPPTEEFIACCRQYRASLGSDKVKKSDIASSFLAAFAMAYAGWFFFDLFHFPWDRGDIFTCVLVGLMMAMFFYGTHLFLRHGLFLVDQWKKQ
jgi:hypothetical protein